MLRRSLWRAVAGRKGEEGRWARSPGVDSLIGETVRKKIEWGKWRQVRAALATKQEALCSVCHLTKMALPLSRAFPGLSGSEEICHSTVLIEGMNKWRKDYFLGSPNHLHFPFGPWVSVLVCTFYLVTFPFNEKDNKIKGKKQGFVCLFFTFLVVGIHSGLRRGTVERIPGRKSGNFGSWALMSCMILITRPPQALVSSSVK